MNVDAVIFDCDGVLVDSEAVVARVALSALRDLGLPYDADTFTHRFTGMTVEAYFKSLNDDHRQLHGHPLPDGFAERLLLETKEEMDVTLEAIPGVHAAVAAINNTALAVASSSGSERLRSKLIKTGLHDAFAPHFYAGDQVSHGKPAPDLFLFAAKNLRVEASACIAIEDSVNGVTSAVAAGMTVIGFTGGSHCGAGHGDFLSNAGATVVINQMDELSRVLEEFR